VPHEPFPGLNCVSPSGILVGTEGRGGRAKRAYRRNRRHRASSPTSERQSLATGRDGTEGQNSTPGLNRRSLYFSGLTRGGGWVRRAPIADIAAIAVIARDRKSKALPGIDMDDTGQRLSNRGKWRFERNDTGQLTSRPASQFFSLSLYRD